MIFIDFALLRSPYCKISYLLADIKIRVTIWQPTYDSVREDNSWIHGKCRQGFYQTFRNVFLNVSHFLRFLTFLFYLKFYYIYAHSYADGRILCRHWADTFACSWHGKSTPVTQSVEQRVSAVTESPALTDFHI